MSIVHCTLSIYICGGVAQLARAPALHAGGQEFDSLHLHQARKAQITIENVEMIIKECNLGR